MPRAYTSRSSRRGRRREGRLHIAVLEVDVVDKRTPHTVHLLQQVGDKVRLVRMVEGRDVELELVGDLQECELTRRDI